MKNINRQYILKENIEFLTWYNNMIKEGYTPFMTIESLQNFIEKIVTWYEMKCPMKNFHFKDANNEENDFEIDDLADAMSIDALRERLDSREETFLDGKYRHKSETNVHELTILPHSGVKRLTVPFFTLTGQINSIEDGIHIEEFIADLDSTGEYDTAPLKTICRDHHIDLELRERIFKLAVKAILFEHDGFYSLNYIRARHFIEEIKAYFDIDLSEELTNHIEQKKRSVNDTLKRFFLNREINHSFYHA